MSNIYLSEISSKQFLILYFTSIAAVGLLYENGFTFFLIDKMENQRAIFFMWTLVSYWCLETRTISAIYLPEMRADNFIEHQFSLRREKVCRAKPWNLTTTFGICSDSQKLTWLLVFVVISLIVCFLCCFVFIDTGV